MSNVSKFTYHGDELDIVPSGWPKRPPPGALELGEALWAFSPGASRLDMYKGWISQKADRAYI